MKVRLFAKVVAILVFAFGAIAFASANFKNSKERPKSFVITSVLTRSENGETPIVAGLRVRIVAGDGQWKQITVRRAGDEYPKGASVRFLDNTASYHLDAGRLEYEHPSEDELERDKMARKAGWIIGNDGFAGEDSMLGLGVYKTRQELSNGWIEQAFSPVTRSAPLLVREHFGNVEHTEEAVSIEFRDVLPDEIRPPNLPISFEWSKRLGDGLASNPANAETVRHLIEQREAMATKLRALGRIE